MLQNIKVATGDMRSPMFEMFRELQFLQVCVFLRKVRIEICCVLCYKKNLEKQKIHVL